MALSHVDLKIRVLRVDLEYKVPALQIFDGSVSSYILNVGVKQILA